jgi:hypothetical protein
MCIWRGLKAGRSSNQFVDVQKNRKNVIFMILKDYKKRAELTKKEAAYLKLQGL